MTLKKQNFKYYNWQIKPDEVIRNHFIKFFVNVAAKLSYFNSHSLGRFL